MAAKKLHGGKVNARPEIIRRKADDERREAVIKVLATADEKAAWKTKAEETGMTVSTWLRHLAIKASKESPAHG
jgi:flagellar biosynthesis/type III secretory pathway ATPase